MITGGFAEKAGVLVERLLGKTRWEYVAGPGRHRHGRTHIAQVQRLPALHRFRIPDPRRQRPDPLVPGQRPARVRRIGRVHRLPRHRQRHHRAQADRAARAPRGPARRADRPAEPLAAAGPPGPGRGLCQPQRQPGVGHADRPRPLQVRQRQHGPQGRRRAPDDGGGAPALVAARRRYRGAPVGRRIRRHRLRTRRPAADARRSCSA